MSTTLPPGPTQGSIRQLISHFRNPYGTLSGNRQKFGDVFSAYLPTLGRAVIVASPDALRQLTEAGYQSFERMADGIRYILGPNAILFAQGGMHRQLRKVIAPGFLGPRMRGYGSFIQRATDEMLDQYQSGGIIALERDMRDLTSRVIMHCVFGFSEGRRSERLRQLLTKYAEGMLSPWAFTGSLLLGGPRFLRLIERLGERQRRANPDEERPLARVPLLSEADRLGAIDAIVQAETEHRRAERVQAEDVFALLARAEGPEGQPLFSNSELRDQVISLLIGGHDTIASTLSWALYHLARHPEVCAEIRREQARVFSAGFDPRRIEELPYLAAVIQETMRLTPTVLGIVRRPLEDVVIEGHTVPAGTPVFLPAFLAHRHPKLWERPEQFEPARFLQKKPPMHSYFPFGTGVWRCLGASFAEFEMRVVLARLVTRFDLELVSGDGIVPQTRAVTVWPAREVKVRLRPRAPEATLADGHGPRRKADGRALQRHA